MPRLRDNARDAQILVEVTAMDTEKDFGGLLQFTNRSETPAIRDLAVRIEKVKPTARGIVDRWLAAHERSGSRR